MQVKIMPLLHLAEPTVTDNEGSTVTITKSHEPGSNFNLGTTKSHIQLKTQQVIKQAIALIL